MGAVAQQQQLQLQRQISNDLLVGNFSFADSAINAFDSNSGTFLGTIPVDVASNTPGGLWELTFGFSGNGDDPNTGSTARDGEDALSARLPEALCWSR